MSSPPAVPRRVIEADAIFVRDGALFTSAGVTAAIDLALALIEEDHGRELALAIARHMVIYLKRPGGQSQFSTHLIAQSNRRTPIAKVQHWAAEHPDADLGTAALAARAAMSPRNFHAHLSARDGPHACRVRRTAADRHGASAARGNDPATGDGGAGCGSRYRGIGPPRVPASAGHHHAPVSRALLDRAGSAGRMIVRSRPRFGRNRPRAPIAAAGRDHATTPVPAPRLPIPPTPWARCGPPKDAASAPSDFT